MPALLASAALCVACAAAALWWLLPLLPPPVEWRPLLLDVLQQIPPLAYFFAFALLPAGGVPLTLFYLTALPILGPHSTLQGLLLAYLALALNIAFTGALTHSLLRPLITGLIANRGWQIPTLNPASEWQVVLAFRLSPMPFVFQNYCLALGRSRWRYYLLLSLFVQATIGTGMMLVGESLFSGNFGLILIAIFIILLVSLIGRFLRKRINKVPSAPISPNA